MVARDRSEGVDDSRTNAASAAAKAKSVKRAIEPVVDASSDENWLTPGVRASGVASLLADIGHEAPTALPNLLASTLGASAAALGLIEGIADASARVARFAGGALANDPGRGVRRLSSARMLGAWQGTQGLCATSSPRSGEECT